MKFLFDWAKYSILGASCCTSSLSLLAKRIRLCATMLNGLGWDGGYAEYYEVLPELQAKRN